MSLKTASQNRASNFTFTNSRSGGGGVGTSSVSITSIVVTDSNFNNLDDTAIATSNSYIKIIGSGFNSSANIWVAGTKLSSGVTYVNSTEIRVTMPSVSLGNTNIFVFNPDNSGAIWAPGLLVSGTPDFTQTAYTSATPLEVSVQLLATGDATLTYELQAGSSLPGTLTLSSGGLITGATVDGVYQFTVIVSDAQLQSFQQQITLTITSTDANFKSTVLAINADANTFVSDGSTNNFPITINGDTKPSAFSPYNTNWSNYFDGTGDNLQIAHNSALNFDGDMTVECWIYLNTTAGIQTVASKWQNGNFSWIWQFSSTTMSFYFSGTASSFAWTPSTNIWYHIAISRSSGSVKFFVNGVQTGSTSTNNTVANTTSPVTIGNNIDGPQQYLTGYISNFRLVKGTAVYTSNFTPPTSALTAIANTSLLTCQSNRFIDNSTNAFAITKAGDTKVSAFGPFTETDTATGSTYFDGTGDYLTVASNSAFTLGSSGDFTVECWVYLTASPSNYAPLLTTWSNASNSYVNRWAITYYNNRLIWYTDAGNIGVTDSVAPTLNEWTHVAAVRSGSTITFYKNGVSLGTQTTAQAYTTDGAVSIGFVAGGAAITGYITNARIIKGTAVYTSAFTPPTAALTAVANTSLLTLQTRIAVNNHTFVDHSGINNLITRAGNASQGSFSPFSPAGWSAYFDGTGDYASVNGSGDVVNFGTGDFTIEAWIYIPSLAARFSIFDTCPQGVLNPTNRIILRVATNGTLQYVTFQGTTVLIASSSSAVTTNVWYHVALVKSSGSTKLYLNGTQVGSTYADSLNYPSQSNRPILAAEGYNPTVEGTGYISNLRVVKGTAVYTSNFTPPTSALTAVANTSLLICQSNRFIDNSTNNFAITRNGDARVVNFSPFAPTVPYSLVTHGGSVYFDGSGDYLEMPAGSNWNFGTGAFTFETWIFPTGASTSYELFGISRSTTNEWSWSVTTGNSWGIYWYWGNSGSNQTERYTGQYPVTGQWNHLVVSRDTDYTWRFYLNGALIATSIFQQNTSWSDSRSFDNTGINPRIGGSFAGWMTDMRVTKGVALYNTSTINLPSAPLTPIPRTIFLSNFNNPGIIDVSSRNVLETVGDAKIRTDIKKYGTGSVYFDGTGDYLQAPNSTLAQFGSGDFTIEFWMYASSQALAPIVHQTSYASSQGWILWNYDGVNTATSTRKLTFMFNGGGTVLTTSSDAYTNSTWTHIAVVKSGTNVKIYSNGSSIANGTFSTAAANASTPLMIGGIINGQSWNSTSYYTGYIDDLRITNGFARYTANFTPPTSTILTQ